MSGFAGAKSAALAASMRGQKRERATAVMPGVNENLTSALNKRNKIVHRPGGQPADTRQNAITTTTINLAPPIGLNKLQDDSECFAPASLNDLANTPSRGDWAFSAPYAQRWLGQIVSSGLNPYSNALPIFTNMARVPKNTRLRFGGIVGNAGQGKQGDKSADNFGTSITGGATTGSNTGPAYIPPLSKVYLSPFPYIVQDEQTKNVKPGFVNPGWVEPRIDKYLGATFALREGDTTAFFLGLENDIRKAATKDDCLPQHVQVLSDLHIHPHLPIFLYAKHFLFQARLELLMNSDPAKVVNLAKKTVETMNRVIKENKAYWVAVEREQDEITALMGSPKWDTRRDDSNGVKDVSLATTPVELWQNFAKLLSSSMEIWKQQFAEHQTFISDLMMGKSRYGSAAGGILDMMLGYNISC